MTNPTLEQRILAHLNKPNYQPLTRPDLAKAMRIHSTERNKLRQALIDLEKQGKVSCLRKNRWAAAGKNSSGQTVTGSVRVMEKGFGLFAPDNGGEEIYIARDDLKCALHEDRVSVELFPKSAPDRRGSRGGGQSPSFSNREGRVVEVLDRKNTEIVGLLRRTPYYAYVIPDNLRLIQDIRVAAWEKGLEETPENYKVVIELNEWSDPFKPLTGKVIEALGDRDDPNVEMQCILRAHGFQQNFSEEVLAEAARMPHELRPEDYENRQDLRKRLTFTIDPETARDFDDAISLEKVSRGWKLSVHIADVAHFVPRGSLLDKEALHRGNSIYLVDRVVMMLPTELTTRICSLNPHVDRLAHTVEILLDEKGQMLSAESCRSIIHSDARLTYEQVQSLFDGDEHTGIPSNVSDAIMALRPLARAARARRTANGSLEINTPQIKCLMDKDGKVASIKKGEAKEAYQLIEECMLLANVAVARKLKDAQWPAIHRIHEEPDEDQWAQMGAELQALGINAIPLTRSDINVVMEKIEGTPLEYTGSLAVLRNLKRAGYSAEPVGHFGLAFEDYVHFTSPIRRYPDLVIHRLLSALEEKQSSPYRTKDIESIAAQCTRTETEADQAEKESIELRRVEYYNNLLYKGETGPYKGCIIRILNKGLIVELTDTIQRGLVPFASITDDRYDVNAAKTRATGQRTRRMFKIGDVIDVELVKVDLAHKFIDFNLEGQKAATAFAASRNKKGVPPRSKQKKQQVTLTGDRPHGPKQQKRRKRK
ncbi:MAG: ribonuclease R [Kiritimatiellaceae bacterium]|nr:ribonuclease R [Kiritimatiellaceae bacterium]